MIDNGGRDPLSVDVPPLRPSLREKREAMPRINLSLQRTRTLEEAQGYMETAVPRSTASSEPWFGR
jgi:hypothetical protein